MIVLYAQHVSVVGKAGGETERGFTRVKSFIAGTGSLQRGYPSFLLYPSQALGASQTLPFQKKQKGSPMGCGISHACSGCRSCLDLSLLTASVSDSVSGGMVEFEGGEVPWTLFVFSGLSSIG